jgi:hypothetical protein
MQSSHLCKYMHKLKALIDIHSILLSVAFVLLEKSSSMSVLLCIFTATFIDNITAEL